MLICTEGTESRVNIMGCHLVGYSKLFPMQIFFATDSKQTISRIRNVKIIQVCDQKYMTMSCFLRSWFF